MTFVNTGSNRSRDAQSAVSPDDLAEDQATVRDMRKLPRSFGIVLVAVGITGVIIPGPIGTPFLVLGGLLLWPAAFRKPDEWMQRKFPKARHEAISVVHRFIDDLDRRYPRLPRAAANSTPTQDGRS